MLSIDFIDTLIYFLQQFIRRRLVLEIHSSATAQLKRMMLEARCHSEFGLRNATPVNLSSSGLGPLHKFEKRAKFEQFNDKFCI